MGRWGHEIYDSDYTLDSFAHISHRLESEMAYWMCPEMITHNTRWLNKVLTAIEVMLLLDQHKIGSTVYLGHLQEDVKLWREEFFKVWDAPWDEEEPTSHYAPYFPYSQQSYRLQHRLLVGKLFDRIINLADAWNNDLRSSILHSVMEEKLPYFSQGYFQTESAEAYLINDGIINRIIEEQVYRLLFMAADYNAGNEVWYVEIEENWVAVDVISLLCEKYAISPSVSYETVVQWQQVMEAVWKESQKIPDLVAEDREMYANFLKLFDRLKAVARQYPL